MTSNLRDQIETLAKHLIESEPETEGQSAKEARHAAGYALQHLLSVPEKRFTMPVLGDKLAQGHVLVGESGGESVIYETDPVDLVMGAMVVKTEHGSLYLDPHECYDVRVETEPWWVLIERERPHRWGGGPNPSLALGPYPTEEDAEAALESSLVDGEMTSKDGGTDCYTVAQSALPHGIGENVAELVHVFVDLDNPDHTGK